MHASRGSQRPRRKVLWWRVGHAGPANAARATAEGWWMNVADLQKILRAVDPAVVLVSPRILERVIRAECRLPNMYWNIPHSKSYVCDRQCLFRHAEQADLELEPE